jgi:hypothetical protein
MAVASNSNDRLGMSTLPQTFEHALIGSEFSKLHRADKSSQPTCEGRTINGGCWCGSDGLLTTASHQGSLLYRRESSSEQPSDYFFFLTKAPMIRVTTEITQSQPSNTVKSNFLDEAKLFWTSESATGSPLRRAPLQLARACFLDNRCCCDLRANEYAGLKAASAEPG